LKTVCITGASGSGKTTLIVRLVRRLSRWGVKVGTLKHAHHDFDMDRRGKDSYRHFHAGAKVSGVIGPARAAVFLRSPRRLRPSDLKPHYRGCDLLILEGFRGTPGPKIEVYRRTVRPIPLHRSERFRVRAVVTKDRVDFDGPVFRPDAIGPLARFLLEDL
jgi:molybdopterin-guanine dinucleotide biosynthesis protein B